MSKLKNYGFLEYLLAVFLVLNCKSIFINSSTIKYLLDISFTVLLMIMVIYKKNHIILNIESKNRIYIFALLFFIYICVFFAFNLQIKNILLIFITLFFDPLLLIMYFLLNNNGNIDLSLFNKLENIILFLAIASLILWPLSKMGILKPNMSIISNWTFDGTPREVPGYFGLLFTPQSNHNTSIFAEAPIYSYVLCIALFIELFMRHHKNQNNIFTWQSIILFLAIITSHSTTGLMVSIPLFMYKLLISHINMVKKSLVLLLFPIGGIILKDVLFNKIGNSGDLTSSYNTRMNDITSSIIAWKNHPLVGNGLYNSYSIQQNMYSFRLMSQGNQGVSTGFFSVLALGGILYALFYIIPTVLALFKESYANKGIAIFNFILLIYTIIPTTHLCILMFSYLMACYIQSLGKSNNVVNYTSE